MQWANFTNVVEPAVILSDDENDDNILQFEDEADDWPDTEYTISAENMQRKQKCSSHHDHPTVPKKPKI